MSKQPHTLNILFLSGAGAVGKTSVVREIEALCEGNISFSKTLSTTRASYAAMGIQDEKSAKDLPYQVRRELQDRIFADYCDNLRNTVRTAAFNYDDLLVVDRSPYDHVSYWMQMFPDLSLDAIQLRLEQANDLLDDVLCKYNVLDENSPLVTQVSIWNFSYPTAWHADVEGEQWKRNAPAAKNYIWSLALKQLTLTQSAKLSSQIDCIDIPEYDQSTPLKRAQEILANLQYMIWQDNGDTIVWPQE